jgi:hypothetical protein
MKTILLQLADESWTIDAVHLASAMAANTGMSLTLLRLIPVNNPGLLGTPLQHELSRKELAFFQKCLEIARAYNIEVSIQPMQYLTRIDALAQAAESCDSQIVFAPLPISPIGLWRKWQHWRLKTALQPRRLYTLDEPISTEQIPAVN